MRRSLDTSKLVGVAEISEMVEVTPQAVTNWRDRYADFPQPVVTLSCGPVFYWLDIERWLLRTGRF